MPAIQYLRKQLKQGCVIPAHPLSLTEKRRLNEPSQRALSRYYLDAGAGGLAVGVHTTQFAIRDPKHGLHQPVLELAKLTIAEWEQKNPGKEVIRIAGICGDTSQAVKEAELALDEGYPIGLLSLSAFPSATNEQLIQHARTVASVIPVMGFYLQPSVGGRVLDYAFWRSFFEIDPICAVKIAPFNRYQTLEVLRAIVDTCREDDIALYTGNDDTIIMDLLSESVWIRNNRPVSLSFDGGLLGHWAVWTKNAVDDFNEIKALKQSSQPIPPAMLSQALQVTDCNAAFFDAAHGFRGCIAGLHEVLVRQGLMHGRWCLDPHEDLSPQQKEEIDRVYRSYPHLHDDDFVQRNLQRWFA